VIELVKDIFSILNVEQKRKLFAMQVLVILTAIAEVCSVAVIGPFMALAGNMEQITNNQYIYRLYILSQAHTPNQFLTIAGFIVLSFLLLSTLLSIVTIYKLSVFAARTGAEIGDSLYSSYLKKNYLFHSTINSSHLIKQIATEVSRVTDNILQPFVQINARIFAVIFISIAIFLYKPIISIIGITVFLLAYYILFILVRKKLNINGINISKVSKKRFLLMNEGFGSIKDVLILNRQEDFIRQFEESGIVFAEAYGSSNTLYNMPRYIMEFIMYSSMISLIIFLLYLSDGDMASAIATLAIFGIAAFKLLPSFQQIYGSAAQIKSNLSALSEIKNDIIEARELEKTYFSKDKVQSNTHLPSGNITLKNVFFKYPNKQEYAIKDISLNIPINGIVGFVGASGAGKSTLLDLLLGLLEPSKGVFLCGNEIINDSNVKKWQKKIGYVPQSIFLKDGSVLENVAFGLEKSKIDIKKAMIAIESAQLLSWIADLPNGIDTQIGEKGIQISGGQKQRIGIARALYNDVDYLFFDEATSALDGKTEGLVLNAIENISNSKTIIMIAHRLNTVRNCNKIYVFDKGRVVDEGSYSYLMGNSLKFKEIAGENTHGD